MLKLLQARGLGWALAVGLAGALFLMLMVRGLLGHTPHYDEFLHILAARGLLQSGAPVIADGIYSRAALFTHAVAWSFRLFGESLEAARLPAVAAGALLVFVTGAWLTRRAGLLVGATAAVLLCVVPLSFQSAVFARFYTAHALVIVMIYIALFEAMEPARSRIGRTALAAVALMLVPLAWHLQETSVIAVSAGIAGFAAVLLLDHWAVVKQVVIRHTVWVLGGTILGAAVALWGITNIGLLDRLFETTLWAATRADRYHYYLMGLGRDLPLLWPLLPVAAALALIHPEYRRLALFSVVVVGAGLLVHSIAAQKAMRYVYYLIPWMCVLWGCGLGAVTLRLDESVPRAAGARYALPPIMVLVLLGAGFVFSVEGARALNLAAGRLGAIAQLPYQDEPDWAPVAMGLAARAASADMVITSNAMKAIYYLGRYDYELNATIVPETDTGVEFGRDYRTGGRAISEAGSVAKVLSLPGTALVVLEEPKIGRWTGVPAESFALIEARCSELALPTGPRVRAWTCATTD